jgi:polysaccharide export outer membrane protein
MGARIPTGFVLDADGNLELPKIGKLKFQGLTIAEAEKFLREKLVGYFETPVVRIQLLSFHFSIVGEIGKEGRYTVFDPNSTVFDAIIIAGNLTEFADRSNIKIVRFVDEKATVFYVNTLRENLLEQPGFFLQPNDLIIVPPLEAKVARKYTIPNYTSAIGVIVSTISLVFLVISLRK